MIQNLKNDSQLHRYPWRNTDTSDAVHPLSPLHKKEPAHDEDEDGDNKMDNLRLSNIKEESCEYDKTSHHSRKYSEELFLSVVKSWRRKGWVDRDVHPTPVVQAAQDLLNFSSPERHSRDSPTRSLIIPTISQKRLSPCSGFNKIGAYSPKSRKILLEKYMEKRKKRLSKKKVRYRVRKTLASARPRVKGRFVKTDEPLTASLVMAMNSKRMALENENPVNTLTSPETSLPSELSSSDQDDVFRNTTSSSSSLNVKSIDPLDKKLLEDEFSNILQTRQNQQLDVEWISWANSILSDYGKLASSHNSKRYFEILKAEPNRYNFLNFVVDIATQITVYISKYTAKIPPYKWGEVNPVFDNLTELAKVIWREHSEPTDEQCWDAFKSHIGTIATIITTNADGLTKTDPV